MATIEFSAGHPCEYNVSDGAKIIECFKNTIVLSNVAGQVRRDKDTIKDWLKRGRIDHLSGQQTERAQFFLDCKKTLSETILRLEDRLLNGEANGWQRIAWYLERCAREDYGQDAGIIEDLKNEFEEIKKLHGVKNG